MQKVKCRTAYNSRDEKPIGIKFLKSSLTQQHFLEECDINLIADRYLSTGVLPENEKPVFYGDVSNMPVDLVKAYEAVQLAEDNFMRLPSEVRKSINNDPSRLMDWIASNKDYAASYGLIVRNDEAVRKELVKDIPVFSEDKKSSVTPDTNASE